jgi:hypothetical protein
VFRVGPPPALNVCDAGKRLLCCNQPSVVAFCGLVERSNRFRSSVDERVKVDLVAPAAGRKKWSDWCGAAAEGNQKKKNAPLGRPSDRRRAPRCLRRP